MSRFISAAKVSEVPEQSVTCVQVEGKRIALFNLGGKFFATDDACTHEQGPLSEGLIDGEEVECPWHGARFNIRSGKVALDPAEEDLVCYKVRVVDDDIEIQV